MKEFVVIKQFRANDMKTYFIGDIISEVEYNVIPDGALGCRASVNGPKTEFLKEKFT